MGTGNRTAVRILRAVFGLLPLVAVGRQLVIHREHGFPLTNFFSYFTNISNILAGCVLLLLATADREAESNALIAVLRATAVINMALVGIVFSLLLRNVDLGSLLPWVNFVVHDLMPCVMVLDWVACPPSVSLGRRGFAACLALPIAYLVYALVRGDITGWYPYPFLNPVNVGGVRGVAMYVIGITFAFFVVGWAIIALGNARRAVARRTNG